MRVKQNIENRRGFQKKSIIARAILVVLVILVKYAICGNIASKKVKPNQYESKYKTQKAGKLKSNPSPEKKPEKKKEESFDSDTLNSIADAICSCFGDFSSSSNLFASCVHAVISEE